MPKAIVLGAGIAGMSAAACLAQNGFQVTLLDKHAQPGGRCRTWEHEGFTFDMGPSWYWMPDVFEHFYRRFNHHSYEFYELKRLDPSYQVVFEDELVDIPARLDQLKLLFERWEPGAAAKLDEFLNDASYKYKVGMMDLVYKPSLSLLEFADRRLLKGLFELQLFSSLQKQIDSLFTHPKIREILGFPVLFLGAKPENTPALYSLMNHADINLGTWYPMGGMVKISEAFAQICVEQGVQMNMNEEVQSLEIVEGKVQKVITSKTTYTDFDVVVSGADYHHTETQLLPPKYQSYSSRYWDTRKMSPSCLLFYVGFDKKIEGLTHHNLFFDADFGQHAYEIYDDAQWPSKPLFYACAPSKTDKDVAPEGKENVFLLMPIAPDLAENTETHEQYFDLMIGRMEQKLGVSLAGHVKFKRSFGVQDFKDEYHSFKGNAYGMANTLLQTAFLKPKMKSKKVDNLYYCGQLTVPGPGLPPSVISGQVIADYIAKKVK